MSHSFTKIWIHAVFSTKDRLPLINKEIDNKIYDHIVCEIRNKYNCIVKSINGSLDHIHILFQLNPNYSLIDIIKYTKGESSHWINFNNLTNSKFSWQVGYSAFSVSESMLTEVENYINKQKEHHKKVSFTEEYDLFMKKYGFGIINR